MTGNGVLASGQGDKLDSHFVVARQDARFCPRQSIATKLPTSTDLATGVERRALEISELPTCSFRIYYEMAQANNSSPGIYHHFFVELADPRTNDWFLIRDPWPGLAVIGLYLYFCLSWGPRFMERREPLQLQKTLIVYNFLQVLFSCWLFYE
ncbi:Elongation of very long chain fatty acids protein AAEL008004, partial [Eumeta japonica]